jgi:hypothetical protein
LGQPAWPLAASGGTSVEGLNMETIRALFGGGETPEGASGALPRTIGLYLRLICEGGLFLRSGRGWVGTAFAQSETVNSYRGSR